MRLSSKPPRFFVLFHWINSPPSSHSHHQDYYVFEYRSPPLPRGVDPSYPPFFPNEKQQLHTYMWDNLVRVYLLVNFWCQLSSSWLETSVSNSKYIDPFTIHAINVFIYSIWWLAGQWLQPISPTRADFGGFQGSVRSLGPSVPNFDTRRSLEKSEKSEKSFY